MRCSVELSRRAAFADEKFSCGDLDKKHDKQEIA